MKKIFLLFLTTFFTLPTFADYNKKELNKKIESTIKEVKNSNSYSKRVEKIKDLKNQISSLTTKNKNRYEYLIGLQLDFSNVNTDWLKSPTQKKCKVIKHKLKEGYFSVHKAPEFPEHTKLTLKVVDAICSPLKTTKKK